MFQPVSGRYKLYLVGCTPHKIWYDTVMRVSGLSIALPMKGRKRGGSVMRDLGDENWDFICEVLEIRRSDSYEFFPGSNSTALNRGTI